MNEGGITMRRRRPFWTAAFLCYRKEKEAVEIRRFKETDAQEVSALIAKTLRTTNAKDYSSEFIENEVKVLTPEYIAWRASWTHFYVACEGERLVGCGAIGPYWGSETESSLFTIFVLPELHGNGIGRFIVRTLEQDEFFLRAERIEIPASVTAAEFYRRMGYNYKNGVKVLDGEGHYRMEKFNRKKGESL